MIVVPYRPHGPDRERAWAWVGSRLRVLHPDLPLVVAGIPPMGWSKASAVNRAVAASDAELVVVCDADVAVEPWALEAAVRTVERGAPWAIPHRDVLRLTPDATAHLLALPPNTALPQVPRSALQRDPYLGLPGGGLFVVSRHAWELVGGFDERFVGWGEEDGALGHALDTLAGLHARGDTPLIHLYHPLADRTDALDDAQALGARYLAAAGDPEAMRALLAERGAVRA